MCADSWNPVHFVVCAFLFLVCCCLDGTLLWPCSRIIVLFCERIPSAFSYEASLLVINSFKLFIMEIFSPPSILMDNFPGNCLSQQLLSDLEVTSFQFLLAFKVFVKKSVVILMELWMTCNFSLAAFIVFVFEL